MSDAVVAQLDAALSRMTTRPGASTPLRFAVEQYAVTWS